MCDKKKKKKKKKTKKLSQFLKSHISGTREAISLKFGMWSATGGGHVHSKNRLVSSRKHRATEVRKLRFLSSCQYTHGCYAPASWAARHTTVGLDLLCGLPCSYNTIIVQEGMELCMCEKLFSFFLQYIYSVVPCLFWPHYHVS